MYLWMVLTKSWFYLHRTLLFSRYSIVWSRITFSLIFETVGKWEIGRKFLVSALVCFLYRDLSLANLHLFGKWNNLIDKLKIWVIKFVNLLALFSRDIVNTGTFTHFIVFQKFQDRAWLNCWKCTFIWRKWSSLS